MVRKRCAGPLSCAETRRVARKAGLDYDDAEDHCEEIFCEVTYSHGKRTYIPAPWDGGRASCSMILLPRLAAKLPRAPYAMSLAACAHPNAFQHCGGLRLRQVLELKRRIAIEQANAPAGGPFRGCRLGDMILKTSSPEPIPRFYSDGEY